MRKLLSFKDLLSTLGDFSKWVCLIANFECSYQIFPGAPLVSRVTPSQLSAGEPSATLQCLTNFNYPTGSVIWSRADGVELSPERYSTSSTGDLLITNVTVEDQAVWVCNVTNLYGTSGASGPVLVLGKYSVFSILHISFLTSILTITTILTYAQLPHPSILRPLKS